MCVCVYVCVCVCVCVFCCPFDKTILEEKEIICQRKIIFCFFASFYISNTYIIASVIQVESIQGDLTESRSLNWEKMQETKRQ